RIALVARFHTPEPARRKGWSPRAATQNKRPAPFAPPSLHAPKPSRTYVKSRSFAFAYGSRHPAPLFTLPCPITCHTILYSFYCPMLSDGAFLLPPPLFANPLPRTHAPDANETKETRAEPKERMMNALQLMH